MASCFFVILNLYMLDLFNVFHSKGAYSGSIFRISPVKKHQLTAGASLIYFTVFVRLLTSDLVLE